MDEQVLSDADILNKVEVSIDFFENRTTGVCTGAFEHTTRCTNQTMGDASCDCLADAANLCAKAHDPNWWSFTACMFANNGSPDHTPGLESDTTFESTVRTCASRLLAYTFDELKTCYTGAEGDQLALESAVRTDATGLPHPTWLYVDGVLVDIAGPPPYTDEQFAAWADEVKSKILAGSAAVV